ncbi:MAG: chorismate synthase [bacterium]
MLRFLTAGESHGPSLTVILEGLPAGLFIDKEEINKQLARRQMGYGRGGRMKIEKDEIEITGGIRKGYTLGSPLCMNIKNKDWENWREKWDNVEPILSPRPGHADLSGAIKYGHSDLRNVLERASARETAARCAVGCVCKGFLSNFGIDVLGYVVSIGKIRTKRSPKTYAEINGSPLFCADSIKEKLMIKEIDKASENGDTLGGVFEIKAIGVPVGLGSYVHWDRRLDSLLAFALMSIPGIKGVEIGLGFEAAKRFGSKVHDEIFYKNKFYRKANNAGGIEGGVSNGEPIIIRCAMKPIPTLKKPLSSVNIETKEKTKAVVERADVCAVPSASFIGEAMTAFIIANAFLERYGGDNMKQIEKRFKNEG